MYIEEEAVSPPDMRASASVDTHLVTNVCKSYRAPFNSSFNSTHHNIISSKINLNEHKVKPILKSLI